jgi:dihydrofolate synthase/folylpolyglutamate synthase
MAHQMLPNGSESYLLNRTNYERSSSIPYNTREFRLDRMRELMECLGNPQQKLKIIHIAGTKGKGSTSAMIAGGLSAAGYCTGLYTSPHLERIEERIRVNGQPCTEAEFATLISLVAPVVEELDRKWAQNVPVEFGPTYFEILTAMAFLHFASMGTDFAVIEVGMGGRLDSTNVCDPLISVITSISFDHTEYLGNSLAQIAREKAGIIKPKVPVISGELDSESESVIGNVVQQNNCRWLKLGRDFSFKYRLRENGCQKTETVGAFDYENRSTGKQMNNVRLSLLGRHQAANAAVSLAVLDELENQGWASKEAAVRQALASLSWPARIEVLSSGPTVIVDAAHNVASVQSLIDTLNESFPPSRRLLVFGTTEGKDVHGMLQLLLPQFEAIIVTRYCDNPRAVEVGDLERHVAEISDLPRFVCDNPTEAWQKVAELATPDHLICITGSFFLAAEMRREIARALNAEGNRSIVQKA